jgi:predicted Rossmann fold flavoprotein
MDPIVVIGAGAAGIMAARRAAELGSEVLLLEKTPRLGTKILISGGGKCNITHDGEIEDVLRAFRPNEARFIRPACYRFTNKQIVKVLTDRGLRVYTRPDGRIFPVDQTAKDVVAILAAYLSEVGVRVRSNTPVDGIAVGDEGVRGVVLRGEVIASSRVVLAVGGSSYPNSGTTGDGFRMAAELGHSLVKIRAALAPIKLRGDRWTPYSGIALRNVVLRARQQGKEVARWRGDTLITHHGISGPCTLGISREVSEAKEKGPVTIEVDVVPAKSFDALDGNLLAYGKEHPTRLVSTFLEPIVPERLIGEVMASAEISTGAKFSALTRGERTRLVSVLKALQLGEVKEVILDKGEVVAGGVSLDEVDPQTMRSRLVKGLYLCGEVLDIAGPVGGYNLQAAFATGFVAGETAFSDSAEETASV